MRTIHERLGAVLAAQPLTHPEMDRIKAMAGIAPLTAGRIFGALRAGRPVRLDCWLATCAVRGLDAVTLRPLSAPLPGRLPLSPRGPFLWWFFAAAMMLYRSAAEQAMRDAARAAGVSVATWCRAEHGDAVDVTSTLRICALMGRHPTDFTAPEAGTRAGAAGSTGNIECNTLNSNGAQAEARAA
jgi:hypothetical protein